MDEKQQDPREVLDRLCKWRSIFAGWQLGTRTLEDPESQAVRDHRELSILLRVEVSALVGLLVAKGVFTSEEWAAQMVEEAEALNASYERRFPGAKATDFGMQLDGRFAETTKGWRP